MRFFRFLFSPRQHQCNAYLETCLGLALLLALLAGAAALMVSEARGQDSTGRTDRTGLDLPIKPVRYGDPYPEHAPRPDTTGEDDPRDTPPPTFYGEEIDSEAGTVVYVLDRSGSMAYRTGRNPKNPSRLDRAREQIKRSISQLPGDWRFGVCAYGSNVMHATEGLVVASPVNKAAVHKWLDAIRPTGGTQTAAAMADCFARYESDLFVLATDGNPNGGTEKAREQIRNSNTQGAVVNVFGIQARDEFRTFCQGVAADSGGSYTDVE